MKYKISIIIPVHNIEKYLENTLNSILNQSIGFENLEVILVDDNSTDGTKAIIEKYVSKYANFKTIYLRENSGLPGKPRNIGLEKATSDYIMFMDHDDSYSVDACEVLYNKITEENVDMVFCRYAHTFNDGTRRTVPSIFGDIAEIKVDNINENEKLLSVVPSLWTKIFKRKFINDNNIRFPEGMLAEDLSFVVNALLNAQGIIYLNNYYGYNYRIRNSSQEKSTIHIRNKKSLMALISGYYATINVLKQEKQEKYFPIIFESHLKYWIDSFIYSDINSTEKIELLESIDFLIEKQDSFGFNIDESYGLLLKYIKNKELNHAVLISKVMKEFKIRENQLNRNYQKSLDNNHEIQKSNAKLQKQLAARNKRVAELQTVKGWLNYKNKNIFVRIKNRIKI